MAKIETSEVVEIIKRKDIDPELLREIVEEINRAVEPDADDEEKAPAVKKRYSIIVSDPKEQIPDFEFTGWVVQIPEDANVMSGPERIRNASYAYNATKRGQAKPIRTIAEAIEHVPAKLFKEQQVWVKTKEPVFVMTTTSAVSAQH